jgi:hypothetical protein
MFGIPQTSFLSHLSQTFRALPLLLHTKPGAAHPPPCTRSNFFASFSLHVGKLVDSVDILNTVVLLPLCVDAANLAKNLNLNR